MIPAAAATVERAPKGNVKVTVPVAALVAIAAAFGTVRVSGASGPKEPAPAAPPAAIAEPKADALEPRVRNVEQVQIHDRATFTEAIGTLKKGQDELQSDVKEILRRLK